jgi:nicotinamide phosphoribosyltransferase
MNTMPPVVDGRVSAPLGSNLILRTDSYKASHWLQYPPGTRTVYSYVEARGGQFSHAVVFGLQAWLREYLARPITQADINEAAELFAAHGEPFNRQGWQALLVKHGGHYPIRIRAVPEGSVLPTKQALVTIQNTDPDFYWLTSFLETELLRAIWYPTTVATLSAAAKAIIQRYLQATSEDPAGQIGFKLHDFGARGVSSLESAALGGLAHLVNFLGTDTVIALQAGRRYYDEPMAGFSIPAAEHSTITSWGREHEVDAYRNMLRQFGKQGALFAVVSDSYDIFNACEHLWDEALKAEVVSSGATLVVRPDSGDPAAVVLKVAQILDAKFGATINRRGYRVLNNVRIIQGDGVNLKSLRECLSNLYHNGYAADNIAFGMGGGLLQQVNRDTLQWAMKCSAMQIGDEWRNVYKAPVGDTGKTSKRGRIEPFRLPDGQVVTVDPHQTDVAASATALLQTVYENGQLMNSTTFSAVRERAQQAPALLDTDWIPL